MTYWYTEVAGPPIGSTTFDSETHYLGTRIQQMDSAIYFWTTAAVFEKRDLIDGTRLYRVGDAVERLMLHDNKGSFISLVFGRVYFTQGDPTNGRGVLRDWGPVV